MKRVFQFTSALLAGAVALSLAACTAPDAGEPAGGSTGGTAAQTDAPQGRWVEQQAEGIPADVYLTRAPEALADGTLVLYAQQGDETNLHTALLTSTDNGLTWQCETPAWAEQTGVVTQWAVRPDGTAVLTTQDGGAWRVAPDGTATQLNLMQAAEGIARISQLCFLADGTLVVLPTAGPMEEGQSLPGTFCFYDIDADAPTVWVQLAGGDTAWLGGGSDEDGNITYFGPNDVVSLLPGQDADGTSFVYYVTSSGDLCRADLDGSTSTIQAGAVASPYSVAMDLDAEDALCYADATGLYRKVPDGGLTEQVVEGSGMSFSLQNLYFSSMCCVPDGSYLVVLIDMATESCRLCRYVFDPSLSAAAETLSVWSLEENATVRAAIQAFTQEHPDCAVEYEVAWQPDSTLTKDDLLRTLNTELLAGDGPDVLILDGADVDAFADSGLLADLSGTVDTGALYDFIAEDFVREDGSIPVLPVRFSVPLMHGSPGTLDGVSTLDDVAALVRQHPARPGELSWQPLEESQRYALGFDSVDSLVRFALQTSQPDVLADGSLDDAALRSLLDFVQTVGSYYGMAAYPDEDTAAGAAGNFGGVDVVSWEASMGEYAQTNRAVFGYGTMTTPSWLGAVSPDIDANGQTILQPGLSSGVYLPGCLAAVNADSARQELAQAFVAALLSDSVQNSYQYDGMPVTRTGIQAFLDRNLEALQEKGYTGGFEELLAQLDTPVILDDALLDSLTTHAAAMIDGSETVDQAAAGIESDLALRFAERG